MHLPSVTKCSCYISIYNLLWSVITFNEYVDEIPAKPVRVDLLPYLTFLFHEPRRTNVKIATMCHHIAHKMMNNYKLVSCLATNDKNKNVICCIVGKRAK